MLKALAERFAEISYGATLLLKDNTHGRAWRVCFEREGNRKIWKGQYRGSIHDGLQ